MVDCLIYRSYASWASSHMGRRVRVCCGYGVYCSAPNIGYLT